MIKFFDIYRQDRKIIKKNIADFSKIIKNNSFVNGDAVKTFEKNFSKFCNTKYAVGCNSGTDAIFFALKLLNLKKNSEVLLPAQTYCATVFSVLNAGLKPVLVDIQKDNPTICPLDLKKKITKKTSALILVHLYGECCNIKAIKQIIKKKKIFIIEDAAQAHGSYDWSYGKKGKKVGSIGNLACFSFYPAKNLGAYGDGGAVTTNNKNFYLKLLKLRNLGGVKKFEHDIVGYNSRLDTIQASILNNKLKELNKNNLKRKQNANFYDNNIFNTSVKKLNYSKGCVYHQYVILSKKEKKIKRIFKKNKIQYGQHYPKPINKLNAVKKYFLAKKFKNAEYFSKYGISLPIGPYLKKNQLKKISNLINSI